MVKRFLIPLFASMAIASAGAAHAQSTPAGLSNACLKSTVAANNPNCFRLAPEVNTSGSGKVVGLLALVLLLSAEALRRRG